MSWLLASGSCEISGISSDKYHQMPFPSKITLYILHKRNSGCDSPLLIPVNNHTTSDQLTSNPIDGWKPLQPAAIHSRIHLEWNVQVDCYFFHFPLKLTIYSSGLPTSFCDYLLLHFHTGKSWLHAQLSNVQADPNRADRKALDSMRHHLGHSNIAQSR